MFKVLVPFISAYLLKRLKIFKTEDSNALINYVIYFAIPAIAFKSAHALGINKNVFKLALLSWLTTLVLMGVGYVIGRFLRMKSEEIRLWVLIISFGNTGFLGYPFTLNFFGEEGLNFAVIYDSLGSFILVLTLGIFIAIGKTNFKAFMSFPPFWALILGFILKPWPIPEGIEKILDFVAPSVFPVILFAIGLAVNLSKVKFYFKKGLLVEGVKIFGGATIAFTLGHLLGISGLPLKVAVLEASMPTMIFTVILALKYKLNHHLAISCASMGIVFSFLTAPLVVKVSAFLLNLIGGG